MLLSCPPAFALLCRRVVNGLQVLIAKGRKNKRRGPLAGHYAPVHVSPHAALVVEP
jgi:hypothetical protein